MFFKKKKITQWNIQDYLKTDEDISNYLETAIEEVDYKYLVIACKDVVEALRRRNARHSKMLKQRLSTKN